MKYILVVGGVCSSLGKGVTTSSIGALLRLHGYNVTSVKIDPYINVDAGLMSPFEHGEVYVLSDGGEVDLDLGNYERWMGVKLSWDHNITTGKVYKHLIDKEREGGFLGKTVQVVPHMTTEIIERLCNVATRPVDNSVQRPDICLIELGGTVGDLESAPFMEALRQLRHSLPPEDFSVLLLTYLPTMGTQKTKPTQHATRTLLSLGMIPDFVVCRCESALEPDTAQKLSQMCGIAPKYVIDAHNVDALYRVPLLFHEQNIVGLLEKRLGLNPKPTPIDTFAPSGMPSLADFERYCSILGPESVCKTIRIGFVGKYTKGADTYFSVMQAFEHCCINVGVNIEFVYVNAEVMEADTEEAKKVCEELKNMDGIFVPGGFGIRGVEGKVIASKIARENKIPFFGVCLGMQVAVIDLCRHVVGHADANSQEFDNFYSNGETKPTSKNHVIIHMLEVDPNIPGTSRMRLGAREVYLSSDGEDESKLKAAYGGEAKVWERHRHRFEFNMKYYEELKNKGVRFTGSDTPTFTPETRTESIELSHDVHPFYVAVQYHPEFVSSVADPSPPFCAFVAAAAGKDHKLPRGNSRATLATQIMQKTPNTMTPNNSSMTQNNSMVHTPEVRAKNAVVELGDEKGDRARSPPAGWLISPSKAQTTQAP